MAYTPPPAARFPAYLLLHIADARLAGRAWHADALRRSPHRRLATCTRRAMAPTIDSPQAVVVLPSPVNRATGNRVPTSLFPD